MSIQEVYITYTDAGADSNFMQMHDVMLYFRCFTRWCFKSFIFCFIINNDCDILPLDGHLLYADDIIFPSVSLLTDCELLQLYLDSFFTWCSTNVLCLCPDKCSIIYFSYSRPPICFNYKLFNISFLLALLVLYSLRTTSVRWRGEEGDVLDGLV